MSNLELQEGKQYVTRSGIVTPPLQPKDGDSFYPFMATLDGHHGRRCWANDGRFMLDAGESPLDLVAEYVESPTTDDHANDLHVAINPMASQIPPLKNRSGDPFMLANRAVIDRSEKPTLPYAIEGWHGPLKGPIVETAVECSTDIARWSEVLKQWKFRAMGNSNCQWYLVRKGSNVAVECGLEKAPLPYPDHTPPELPSMWHRWEYRGTQISGLQPPWYSVSKGIGVSDVQHVGTSAGLFDFHYFQAVTDIPMLCVNGIWFPEPQREPLVKEQEYYFAVPTYKEGWRKSVWRNDDSDKYWLSSGLIHATLEAAAAHAKAMLSLTAKGGAK